ncbi:MAG: DMT family transporter [Proteobacteria bacterium]|nr:DMT family transporter [Pseudomonadota bacterium]
MLPHNPALRGILLMFIALGLFTLMDTIGKYLSRWHPVPGIVWARYAINLLMLLGFLAWRGEQRYVRTARPAIQIARGLLLGAATVLYFTALSHMPLADASAIAFVLPLFVAVLAVPMLGERLHAPRLIAILVGLMGALVIVRPGSAAFTVYALLPLGMALLNALYQILTRKVAGVEPALTSLFYGSLVGAVVFAPVLPFAWQTPQDPWHWVLLLLLGLLATVGHFILIRAFDYAPATLLAPFVYSQLLWTLLVGFLVFGDFPDGQSLFGMAIIVGAGLYLVARQRLTIRK